MKYESHSACSLKFVIDIPVKCLVGLVIDESDSDFARAGRIVKISDRFNSVYTIKLSDGMVRELPGPDFYNLGEPLFDRSAAVEPFYFGWGPGAITEIMKSLHRTNNYLLETYGKIISGKNRFVSTSRFAKEVRRLFDDAKNGN